MTFQRTMPSRISIFLFALVLVASVTLAQQIDGIQGTSEQDKFNGRQNTEKPDGSSNFIGLKR